MATQSQDGPESSKPQSPLREITQPFIDLVHAPRALWGVNLAYIIEGMCYFGIVTGYLHMYFNDYVGLNDISAGRMVGVLTAGITIAMFFLGTVADRKGVRFALLAAFVFLLVGRGIISSAPIIDPSNVRIAAKDAGRNDPIFAFTDVKPVAASPEAPEPQTEVTDAASSLDSIGAVKAAQTPSTPEPSHESAPAVADPVESPQPESRQASTKELSSPPTTESPSPGYGGTAHWLAIIGILLIAFGYGMYQPGAYAAVRHFTTEKTANMGYAMLYALMNLGGWFPTYAFMMRNNDFKIGSWSARGAGLGILGMIWVYAGFTALSLLVTYFILSRRTVAAAIATAKAERAREKQEAQTQQAVADSDAGKQKKNASAALPTKIPFHIWGCLVAAIIGACFIPSSPTRYSLLSLFIIGPIVIAALPEPSKKAVVNWIVRHPLSDLKFFYFIFCLIPVQTLFAHNWLTLPMYVSRAYQDSWPWISKNWEPASNFNPILVFIFVPIVAALTQKANVYRMMIIGTFVMAAPSFLLVIGPHWWTLLPFLVIMTLGEAMWQPRFLQYAAEIAPEGRTGIYMGVAQFPWFLTKVIVPVYSGWFLLHYCPEQGAQNSQYMWLIYGCIAMMSTVLLILAKGWLGKDFKTKAD